MMVAPLVMNIQANISWITLDERPKGGRRRFQGRLVNSYGLRETALGEHLSKKIGRCYLQFRSAIFPSLPPSTLVI